MDVLKAGFKKRPQKSDTERTRIQEVADSLASPAFAAHEVEQLSQQATLAAAPTPGQTASGQVISVDIARVRENPENPRVFRASDAIDNLAASIRDHGQKVPCAAYIAEDGLYTVIDGNTRLAAIRSIGLTTIRLEIHPQPASAKELYLIASRMNTERNPETVIDKALAWSERLKKNVFASEAEIARLNKIDPSTVNRIVSIAHLPRDILQRVAEQPEAASLRILTALAQFYRAKPDPNVLHQLVGDVLNRGVGSAEIDARRKKIEAAPESRPRLAKTNFRYGGKVGEIAVNGIKGRVELRITGLSEEDCQRLARELTAMGAGELTLQP